MHDMSITDETEDDEPHSKKPKYSEMDKSECKEYFLNL